ncbi:hypothetical protein CVT25_001482 [Psilocybe cyanescens]|uniref:Uncharacterized protein n=1 Tax=Psilocybe cyanescens TaxID=93625 RepID=A0A409X5G0_PSICY|nr:hypothetical protein CVT25_001482 [Psilocybe cyanescens]
MCVLSTASFFPTTTISPFPFSLRCLALFTAAIVTIATAPHLPLPFLPRDSLVITICKADQVAAALLLLKIEREGDLGGTGEGGTDTRVDSVRHCHHIIPPPLPLPAQAASSSCHPTGPSCGCHVTCHPHHCQLMWPPHCATPLDPSVAAMPPITSAIVSSGGPTVRPPCLPPLLLPLPPLSPLLSAPSATAMSLTPFIVTS